MLGYRTRRRLSLLALLIGLPLYIIVAVSVVNWAEARWGGLPFWAALLVYVGLGLLWVLPLKPVFTGVGRGEAEAQESAGRKP